LAALGATLFAAAMLAGCGETGPAGPPGSSAMETCLNCHGDAATDTLGLSAIGTEYEHSTHAQGVTFERKTAPCNGCHAHEGFLGRVATGAFPTETLATSSPVRCWTCHAPHSTGNFSVRTQAPVVFLDGSGTFDSGQANLCAHCHQSRAPSPAIPAAADSIRITSTRWGPHHAPQANILAGYGGFAGTTPLTNSRHTELLGDELADACIVCHMAPVPSGGLAGGHSMHMQFDDHGAITENKSGCYTAGCHTASSLTSFDYKGVQTEMTALMATAKGRLVGAGLLSDSDAIVANQYFTGNELRAVWNYLVVLEDRSLGMHNTAYTRGLLNAVLELVPAP
jgi:hypothetical protein